MTGAGQPGGPDTQAIDGLIASLTDGLTPEQAAQALALLAARTATRTHTLARAEAGARRGAPDWPAWAALQNAARQLVLQASTCRDLAGRLGGPPA